VRGYVIGESFLSGYVEEEAKLKNSKIFRERFREKQENEQGGKEERCPSKARRLEHENGTDC